MKGLALYGKNLDKFDDEQTMHSHIFPCLLL